MLRFFDIKSLILYFRNLNQRVMKHLTMIIFLLIAFSSIGQSLNTDERLLKKFSQEEINGMSEQDLNFEIYCLDNAFKIQDYSDNKEENNYHLNGLRKIEDLNNVNLEDLKIKITENTQYFKISYENKVIVVKSLSDLKVEFKNINQ
jgi:hypothetical protein